jgi:hypothetical protein
MSLRGVCLGGPRSNLRVLVVINGAMRLLRYARNDSWMGGVGLGVEVCKVFPLNDVD